MNPKQKRFFVAQLNKKLAKSACNSLFCLIFYGLRKYSRDMQQVLTNIFEQYTIIWIFLHETLQIEDFSTTKKNLAAMPIAA